MQDEVCLWPQAQNSELHDQPSPHERLSPVLSAKWQFSISRNNTITSAKSPRGPAKTFSTELLQVPSTSVTPKSLRGQFTRLITKSLGGQVTKSPKGPKDSISSLLYNKDGLIRITQNTSAKSSVVLILLQSSIGIDQSFLGTHHQRDEGCWSTSPVPFTPELRLQQEEKSDATSSPSYAILQCPKDSLSGSQSGTGMF